jgi:Enolase C-terminal domain-like
MALIQRAVKTPIATGERLVGLHAFRDLLEARAASVIQPDITHCGGLSEPGGSPPWPRPTVWPSPRTTPRGR